MLNLWCVFTVISVLIFSCAAEETCYPPGGVAGIVVATIIVTFVVGALGTAVAYKLWTRSKGPKGRNQIDGQPSKAFQKQNSEFAFDNPYFRDPESNDGETGDKGKNRSSVNEKNSLRSSKVSDLSAKGKKSRSGKNHFMFGGGGRKQRAMDDSCLSVEPERTIVSLRGHDFTGLGFNICGNMRDGILVKDVLHRGPASESGLIKAGDKIINVTVSFTNIVYEDALTILSYASPYDVQLEIERIPDKSRAALPVTPSGSKRLGSCSFNNSGQKLFHPLYRSQSIDDLTQIDKDGTFPSHGIGPRRSQSVGVAAHKLAAHFKNSDSKLEDKERSAGSLMLSTTGSLNEKMLANVMSDGSIHKNGLQWEKRFEDTLDSDNGSNNDTQLTNLDASKHSSKSQGILKVTKSTADDNLDSSNEQLHNTHNYKQNVKYLDSPHQRGKLEPFKSPDQERSNSPADNVKSGRAKTMAEASHALWHLDQSIREGDMSLSEKVPQNSGWRESKHEEYQTKASTPITKNNRTRKDNDDSDVSNDSLELSNRKRAVRKSKKSCARVSDLNEGEIQERNSDGRTPTSVNKQSYQQKGTKKSSQQTEAKTKVHGSSDYSGNAERVYVNNIMNKSTSVHNSSLNDDKYHNSGKDYQESKQNVPMTQHEAEHKQPVVYANHRDVQETTNDRKIFINDSSKNYGKINGRNVHGERQKLSSSENYNQNYGCTNKIIINGDTDTHKSKLVSNSKTSLTQKGTASSYQTHDEVTKNETDSKFLEKSKPNSNQKAVKKSAHPAGMFTQINPFQQPARHKNANIKIWTGKEDTMDSGINGDHAFSSPVNNNYTIFSTSHPNQRNFASESQNYGQRDSNDISKSLYISSYENTSGHSLAGAQNSPLNYHQQNK